MQWRVGIWGNWLPQDSSRRAETRLAKIASDPFTGDQIREEPAPNRARAVEAS
jgi:hypothetical protein